MFKEIDITQYMNKSNKPSKDKNLVVSFSLLMRLFEWCKEDAKDDVDLHKMMEKLVAFNDGVNPLTIDVYDCLISDIKPKEENDESYASDEDLQNAYELGQEYAENDIELSSDGGDYSLVAGEIITDEKDNGYGASNSELEQFWQGYNATEPTIIELNCDEELPSGCLNCCDLDEETESEIQKLVNMSRM